MHTYRRTGKEESTIFETERETGIDKEEIVDDFSDDSDSGEEKLSEAADKIIEGISKYKFFFRIVIMNVLYFQSLEKCEETYKKCYAMFHSHFIYWGVYLLISALIFVNLVINSFHGIMGILKAYRKSGGNDKSNFFLF